jgi:hypothetical protein
MPGMNSGLNSNNPVLVAAFRAALLHQGIIALPALPRWMATLALGPGGRVDAIAAHLGTFADWRLSAAAWSKVQTVQVTIPYGSSG